MENLAVFTRLADVLPRLPEGFCSFIRVSPKDVPNPLQIDFSSTTNHNTTASLSLVGYSVAPPKSFSIVTPYFVQATTYWRVNTSQFPPMHIELLLFDGHGKQEFSSIDFPALSWCPTSTWKPGTILRVTSSTLWIYNVPNGLAHVAIALLPYNASFGAISSVAERLPLQKVKAPASVTPIEGANAIQLESFIK